MKKKTINKLFLYIFTALIFIEKTLPMPVLAVAKADTAELKKGLIVFLSEYKILVAGVSGIGILSGVLAFIWLLMQLAAKGDIPQERSKILAEMGVVGVTTALLGSLTFIVSVYYSVIIN